MKELIRQYDVTKNRAMNFMKQGELNAYVDALLEMNRYKALITVKAN
jgi:hypothetical protein